jgi:hypothetical protein
MEKLINYLERRIELCTELNMPLEKWAFSDCLKEARSVQLMQTAVIKPLCPTCGKADLITLSGITYCMNDCFQ